MRLRPGHMRHAGARLGEHATPLDAATAGDAGRAARTSVVLAGGIGALVASLCCAGPLLIAALGLLSIPAAGALGDRLFYGYWWAFVSGGLIVSGAALTVHLRSRGVCSLGAARRRRREIVNAALIALLAFTVFYLIWDYVIVEAIGVHFHLWPSPFQKQ